MSSPLRGKETIAPKWHIQTVDPSTVLSDRTPSLSRRVFLLRTIAVAGGALALPMLSQRPALCAGLASSRARVSDPATPSATSVTVSATDLKQVTDNILCAGGCGKTVYVGEFADACPIATKMKLEAAGYLAQGMSPQQALDRFAADFGEGVLAAPPKSGFNLLLWLVPLVGLGLGGVGVARTLMNWKGADRSTAIPGPPGSDPAMRSRIDDEVGKGG